MAIFTNKVDRSLPLLTRAYQVDTNSVAEITAFMRQAGDFTNGAAGDPDDLGLSVAARARGVQTREEVQTLGRVLAQNFREARQEVTEAVKTAREVMDSIESREAVRMGALIEITHRVPRQIVFRQRAIFAGTHQPAPHEEVRIDNLMLFRVGGSSSEVTTQIYTALLEIVMAEMDGKKMLARCPECSGVFAIRKSGQTYCSHRCADRVAQRKKRSGTGVG